ncbi:MAG: arsenate reductase [Candidatus Marinamargulisbacteria bacterium]
MIPKILFVCTHNSCRSQIAEGLLRHFRGDQYEVFSAGAEKTHVKPGAIETMAEIGIDISGQSSKTVASLSEEKFALAITVCDSAQQTCSPFLGNCDDRAHWPFFDPSTVQGTDDEIKAAFRKTRNEIKSKILASL